MLLFLWVPSLCCLLIHSRILVNAVPAECDFPCPREPQMNDNGDVIFVTAQKCRDEKQKCKQCANQNGGVECEDLVDRLRSIEVLQTPKDTASIPQPSGCNKNNPDSPACQIDGDPTGRKKRGIGGRFHPKYVWHQDDKLPKDRQACMTTKRVIHYVTSCGKDCYPVFCPLAGGHQFIDEVVCNVTLANYQQYQAKQLSQPKRGTCGRNGDNNACSTSSTLRTYLVTNVPPLGWWGHCLFEWVPVWFQNVVVPTHCYCEFKMKA